MTGVASRLRAGGVQSRILSSLDGHTRRLTLDASLVILVAAVNIITISSATVDETSIPPYIAYALGIGMALPLVVRRCRPVGTLLAATAVFTAYNWLSYPGFVPALPLAVHLYTAAAAGHLRWPIVISSSTRSKSVIVMCWRRSPRGLQRR